MPGGFLHLLHSCCSNSWAFVTLLPLHLLPGDEGPLFVQVAAHLLWLLCEATSTSSSAVAWSAQHKYMQTFMPAYKDLTCLMCYNAEEARAWLQLPHLTVRPVLSVLTRNQQTG